MAGEFPPGVRNRTGATGVRTKSPVSATDNETLHKIEKQKDAAVGPYRKQSERGYKFGLLLMIIAGFVTRFWKLNHPNQVVFDEVHFGKVRLPSITSNPLSLHASELKLTCVRYRYFSLHLMYDPPPPPKQALSTWKHGRLLCVQLHACLFSKSVLTHTSITVPTRNIFL